MQDDVSQPDRPRFSRTWLGIILVLVLVVAAAMLFFAWRPDALPSSVAALTTGETTEPSEDAGATPTATPQTRAGTAVGANPVPTDPETPGATPNGDGQASTEDVERVEQQQGGLEQRLMQAEQRLARLDLQAQAAAGNAARAEGLLIAFATRRHIERGAELGYLADQLRLRFGDALPNAVQTLIDMSRDPVTLDQLLARLEGLEPDLRSARNEPGLARLRRELSNLFIVRRQSAPSPQPRRRLERARMFLETGRYEAAIEEVQNMPGAEAAEGWIADVRRYALAQRSLDLIETTAVLEPRRLRDGTGEPVDQPSPVTAAAQDTGDEG